MKLKLFALVVPSLFMANAYAAPVEGASGVVNFTGKIVQTACSITSENENITVPLGDVASSLVSKTGMTSSAKQFHIKLEGCNPDIATSVSASFDGDKATGSATALATQVESVGIQILDGEKVMTLDGTTQSSGVTVTEGEVQMPFSAQYIALDDNVAAAGEANAAAQFTVSYK